MLHAEVNVNEAQLCTVLGGQTVQQSDQIDVDARGKPPTKSHSRSRNNMKKTGKHGSNLESESHIKQIDGDSRTSESPLPLVDQQVTLAVKLPSGQRIEHHFKSTEKLSDVLHYVEVAAQQDFTNCEFVAADRRTVLTDLNLTIASSGVLSRTVLYLQLPDET